MRKSTKWVVYGIVILIIAAAILFVWVYPQLDRSAQQTIRDIQTGALADDTQTESPTVDGHTEADNGGVPTAAPEALAVGLRGVGETIHDTETMGEGSRDYTLNRVDVWPLRKSVNRRWNTCSHWSRGRSNIGQALCSHRG